jgi:glucose 1-dehydrogenase
MRLAGKVALVTGSSKGIGRGIAVRFAQEGADIIINHRNSEAEAQEVLKEVEALGRKGFIVKADLAEVSEIVRLVDEGLDHFGKIDILVNNAGIEIHAPFWEVKEADYDKVMNVNCKGVFFATQELVKHWLKNNLKGKIVNISSVHEDLPFPNFTAYCVAKGGLKMFARNIAIELAPFGITVNNIAPGAIETPINTKLLNDPVKLNSLLENIPLKRLGKPTDVANVALFLASDESDYVTGTTYYVDGGLTWNYQEQ